MARNPLWKQVITGLLERTPYSRVVVNERVVVRCAHCDVESSDTRRPRVHDHSYDCPWAAAMEAVGRGHE